MERGPPEDISDERCSELPHKRSKFAKQRRFISRLVSRNAHRDREKAESVNLMHPEDIATTVKIRFGNVNWSLIFGITKGEVLSESRGSGSLQQTPR